MANIEKAKNHEGKTIFPVTVSDAVLMGNGKTLKGELSELGSKVIYIVGIGNRWQHIKETGWEIGDVMYNNEYKELRKVKEITSNGGVALWDTPNPTLSREAIYICNGTILIWNGEDLLQLSDIIKNEKDIIKNEKDIYKLSYVVVEIAGFGTAWYNIKSYGWKIGDLMFNTKSNVLKKVKEITSEGGVIAWEDDIIPRDPSLFLCSNKVYLWSNNRFVRQRDIEDNEQGLKAALSAVSIAEDELQPIETYEGKYIDSNGVLSDNELWITKKYDVSSLESVVVSGQSGSSNPLCMLTKNDESVFSTLDVGLSKVIDERAVSTVGYSYIYVNTKTNNIKCCLNRIIKAKEIEGRLKIQESMSEDLNFEITKIESSIAIPSDDLEPIETYEGKYIDSNGNLSSNLTWTTKKYDISNENIVFISGRNGSVNPLAVLVSSEGKKQLINIGSGLYVSDVKIEGVAEFSYILINTQPNVGPTSCKKSKIDVIKTVEQSLIYNRNNLKGKVVAFIGDSITAGGSPTSQSNMYHQVFGQKYGAIIKNLGIWSTSIARDVDNLSEAVQPFINRVTENNLSNASMIVVFGGINDYAHDNLPIGDLFVEETVGSNKVLKPNPNTNCFAGALHELINAIRSVNPLAQLLFMTPLQGVRGTDLRTNDRPNKNGDMLEDFRIAINKICEFYMIPVFNIDKVFNYDPNNEEQRNKYFADGLHPNDDGHILIGELLFRYVESNIAIL